MSRSTETIASREPARFTKPTRASTSRCDPSPRCIVATTGSGSAGPAKVSRYPAIAQSRCSDGTMMANESSPRHSRGSPPFQPSNGLKPDHVSGLRALKCRGADPNRRNYSDPDPAATEEDTILARLLALNLERADS